MERIPERKGSSCRFCGAPLSHTFVDLGMSPLCESYRSAAQLKEMEPFYPLHVYACGRCFLVQLEEFVPPEEIFTEYAYFSSYSDSWLAHARTYVDTVTGRFGLSAKDFVIELASNDGYLLQYFVGKGIPALGVEPAANVAAAAVARGVPTLVKFFGERTARDLAGRGTMADLVVANNVLAQVPDLNDFVKGMKILLKPGGVVTVEFPHLLRLIEENQFDTIYHEHFSYFSFRTAEQVFAEHGLVLFDVEEIPTHGGSLRIFGRHLEDASKPVGDAVARLKEEEAAHGLDGLPGYASFGEKVKETKRKLLEFLIRAKREGKRVA
jgi:SAM-dependent methyltransferase